MSLEPSVGVAADDVAGDNLERAPSEIDLYGCRDLSASELLVERDIDAREAFRLNARPRELSPDSSAIPSAIRLSRRPGVSNG